jgi:DNA-directed RNA polymerase alpha subunit
MDQHKEDLRGAYLAGATMDGTLSGDIPHLSEEFEEWYRLKHSDDFPIFELQLTTRSYRSLSRGGIQTIGELREFLGNPYCDIKGFGFKAREHTAEQLRRLDAGEPLL